VSNACHLSQSLLLASLREPSSAQDRKHHAELLRRRYRKLKNLLEEPSPHFRLLPCNSGYFLCVELADGIDADRVRRLLLDEYGTGVIALGSLIRIAFSSVPESNMEQLVRNIREACSRASSFAS
ncbi:aminotransferase class I/II-fold pyridoxal phosphate-dependent enzyme, partial [Candidatus Peregrinibacteria bacterium]|nr:aminotransferase class I/II-fold pyridoxal phosphate-dependent enzyme [Candidatus Peregrinibacteria bacterium]